MSYRAFSPVRVSTYGGSCAYRGYRLRTLLLLTEEMLKYLKNDTFKGKTVVAPAPATSLFTRLPKRLHATRR